jgi:hypothetical protein
VNDRKPLDVRFFEFHQANPAVYDELVTRARAWRERHGSRKLAIATIYEVVRWFYAMETDDPNGAPWRLNNDWRSFYSRLIMEQEPDLAGVFETRQLHAAPEPFSGRLFGMDRVAA